MSCHFIHMVYPSDDSREPIMVCMCPRHREEAEQQGWTECNPDHFLADFCEEHQVCERCEDEKGGTCSERGGFAPGERVSQPTVRPGRMLWD